jgi:hypothetical protein
MIVTDAGCGCGGRGSVLRATGSQGGSMRPVSDHQASGREMLQRTAKSCGPDTPTLVSSSRSCVGPTGLRQNHIRGTTVAKEPGHRGERDISRKTIACGNAGRSGVLVVTRVRSTNTKCTRGRGCSGHPAFPTPSKGAEDKCKPRAHRAARARAASGFAVMARSEATKQSILPFFARRDGEMDCFAPLAMTVSTLLVSWLFEN